MKVFLASSQESLEQLREISSWIEAEGHEPVPWDSPSLFLPGENTFEKLIEISKEVDAAIFIFAEDDKVWYRADALLQPRDNVLIEFGVFAGSLGQRRAIICTKGSPKTATDLRGIVVVDKDKPQYARLKIQMWIKNLMTRRDEDPAISVMKRDLEDTKLQLEFERQKAKELQDLLTDKGVVNFGSYDFTSDAHWKLLFDYDYFWSVVSLIKGGFRTPRMWHDELKRCGLSSVTNRISWEQMEEESRTRPIIAKCLRVVRRFEKWQSFSQFLNTTNKSLQESIESVGRMRAQSLSQHTE